MTKNFPNRGHSHKFIDNIGDITSKFAEEFGYYFQKDFGTDFRRTTRKFGLKW